MDDQIYHCRQCGSCCYQEIPVTLLDIHRIASHKGLKDEEAFRSYIQKNTSKKSGLFKIVKNLSDACIFLDESDSCSIHEIKPHGCNLYFCYSQLSNPSYPADTEAGHRHRASLWSQSVAAGITKYYIEKNGTKWNKEDYSKAISNIYANISTNENQTVKLGKRENGHPICQIYNCDECHTRGRQAKETIVTLDDITRIVEYLNTTRKNFFLDYIAELPSDSEILQLHRNITCVFFSLEEHCLIQPVRPMHCRFTPCPAKVCDSGEFDCLYLGSGTIWEQFRHQAAIKVTKDYVQRYGVEYHPEGMIRSLDHLEKICKDTNMYLSFCKNIVSYRYFNDPLHK